MTKRQFPSDFVWGAATAAYQVEGAAAEDGKGRSIWDTFCEVPGVIVDGSTGAVACDQYHRYAKDVAIMAELGLGAYRFSISWPRVQPDGRGPANPQGLYYYRRLVDELHAHDIEPYVTLYHWDLPQALQDAGGWPARDTAYRFADYAELVADALGDGVSNWITLNEPMVAANAGYGNGIHAPGIRDLDASLAATHHLLLGHGLGLAVLRERVRPGSRCGISLNQTITDPATSAPADAAAASRVDGHNNRMYLDPVLTGAYPADMVELFGPSRFASVAEGDLELISRPIDFLGVNYYRRSLVRAAPGVDGQASGVLKAEVLLPEGVEVTAVGWPVQADGLRDLLVHLTKQYPGLPPLMVTENGAAFADPEPDRGTVDDARRLAYLHSHLGATYDALEAGVDVRGYFVWTLVDNFEWAEGYTVRFGIVHVDYASQQRTIKSSGRWYGKVASTATLPEQMTHAERGGPENLA